MATAMRMPFGSRVYLNKLLVPPQYLTGTLLAEKSARLDWTRNTRREWANWRTRPFCGDRRSEIWQTEIRKRTNRRRTLGIRNGRYPYWRLPSGNLSRQQARRTNYARPD